jgi:hypothetical protein
MFSDTELNHEIEEEIQTILDSRTTRNRPSRGPVPTIARNSQQTRRDRPPPDRTRSYDDYSFEFAETNTGIDEITVANRFLQVITALRVSYINAKSNIFY